MAHHVEPNWTNPPPNLPTLAILVPRRPRTYVLMAIAGLAAICVLGGLYILSFRLASYTTDGSVAAFDLDAEGSIACWLSVALLLVTAQVSLLIATLCHSLGRPAGQTRAWLALAALWGCMSLDEGASLHEGFKELMTLLLGTRIFGDGSIYWVVPYAIAVGLAALFLLARCRRNPAALACLISWVAAHLIAVATQLELVLAGRWPLQILVEESAELAGYMSLLMAQLLYARSLLSGLPAAECDTTRSSLHVHVPHLSAAQLQAHLERQLADRR